MIRKRLMIAGLAGSIATGLFASQASANDQVLGALLGAGIGAAIGHGVNGHDGAAVGSVLGAIAGAGIAAANARDYHDGYYGAPAPYGAAPYYGAASVYYAPSARYYHRAPALVEPRRPHYRVHYQDGRRYD